MLNLKKNDVLNLTKKDPGLKELRIGAGWDVAHKSLFGFGHDYDLDLFAFLVDKDFKGRKNSLIYYGHMDENGVKLHGDNRTGAGDGDDEVITIKLDNIPNWCRTIILGVNIYQGKERKQSFAKVRNSYIRVLNEETGKPLCNFSLEQDTNQSISFIGSMINYEDDHWNFKAIGEFNKLSLQNMCSQQFLTEIGEKYR
ncbi:MAG: TerD family protein [Sarcina sp.]